MPRIRLIYHPHAGRADADDWLENLTRRIEGDGYGVVDAIAFEDPAAARDAARDAAGSGDALVLAAGGDGTVRAVADGLVGTPTALGVLPRGTINVLARELAIPLDNLDDALRIALDGDTRRIDLGYKHHSPGDNSTFLLMCSAGFDAQAVASVNPDLKSLFGAPAYAMSAIGTLATYVAPRVTLTIDNAVAHEGHAFLIVVANAASYGGDLRLLPDAVLDDGVLDVCVFAAPDTATPLQATTFLAQLGAVALNRHVADPNIHFFQGKKIAIETDSPIPAQIDGDPCGETPLQIDIQPAALAIRVPRTSA